MKKGKVIFLAAIVLALIASVSCKKEVKLWQPNPPYPGLEVMMSKYIIDPDKDTVLMLSNGSSIAIPAKVMVNSEGQIVNGTYDLYYREFHDAVDILLSGIPMEIYSMGQSRVFQTAGMFELVAQQDGRKLNLAEGKNIDIRFASKYPGADYNFFFLNPENSSWEWVDLPETEDNSQKKIAQQALSDKEPKIFLGDKYFVLNYNRFLDIFLNDDYYKIYEKRNDKSLKKKLVAYNFKLYNVFIEGELQFLRSYYHPAEMLWQEIDDKVFPSWTKTLVADWKKDSNGKWVLSNYSFSNLGNNIYLVSYKEGNKSFTKKMEVVMPLSSILKLSAENWQQQYDKAMENLKADQEKIDLMAETYRSFSINKLGTYNFDCLLKGLDEWTKVNASFTLDSKPSTDGNVIIILGDNSGYITVKPNEYSSMRINPKSGHRILMLMANQQLGVFPAEKQSSMNIDSMKTLSSPSYTFTFEGKKVTDAVEFRKIMGFK